MIILVTAAIDGWAMFVCGGFGGMGELQFV
jgi:hypothetical protein